MTGAAAASRSKRAAQTAVKLIFEVSSNLWPLVNKIDRTNNNNNNNNNNNKIHTQEWL